MKHLFFVVHKYILLTLLISTYSCKSAKIAIIGTGYVGLVTGAGLAEIGNDVICGDINKQTIADLNEGEMPIHEPGLREVVERNVNHGRIEFTTDCAWAMQESDILFIAVPTPMNKDGSANLRYVEKVVEKISENCNRHKVIVTKSTVPVGTNKDIKSLLINTYGVDPTLFDIVSNPEFLREGSAVEDFLHPDRIVIGVESKKAEQKMYDVYQGFIDQDIPIIVTSLETAELAKYAANAFLSVKLSFVNEMANMCDATGANMTQLTRVLGSDHRVSNCFLNPGPGYGGSCFPKDTEALVHMAYENNILLNTVSAAIAANMHQKTVVINKSLPLLQNDLCNKMIAVLGLAFKDNTDDIRYSPAIDTINELLKQGAFVNAYDPEALNNMKKEIPPSDHLNYYDFWETAVENSDALIIMTEWPEFAYLDITRIKELMNTPIIVDARNMLDPQELKEHGFIFDNIGMSCLAQRTLEID